MTALRRLASRTATSLHPIAAQRRSFSNTLAPRVASEPLPGPFSGVGVYIDAGSRYEDPSLRGVSHIIDRLAFKSTRQRSGDDMFNALESLGGTIQCASSRESLMYQSASFNSTVPTTLQLLAETIREPSITEEEVHTQLAVADYEITELWAKPETILMELINVAAYKDNTLGNPLLCPRERLGEIDRNTILRYREKFFTPERMVVAFAGVPHEKAVSLTEGLFGDMKKSVSALPGNKKEKEKEEEDAALNSSVSTKDDASTSPSPPSSSSLWRKLGFSSSTPSNTSPSTSSPQHTQPFDMNQPAHYTGGFLSLPAIPPPASPALPRLSYIHLAFEALPISSPDIYAIAALQTLLGGGGSFSA
ncbi:Mitochondrial-processing peptidase subunit alpha, partial [Ascosphaera aggregata]